MLERIECLIPLASVSENLTVGDLTHVPLWQNCCPVLNGTMIPKQLAFVPAGKFNTVVLLAL